MGSLAFAVPPDGSRMTRLELANGGIVVGRVIEVLPDALHLVGPDLNRKIALADLAPGTLAELGLAGQAERAVSNPQTAQGLELTRARLLEGETSLREAAALRLIPLQTQEVYWGGGGYAIEPLYYGYGGGWSCWGNPYSFSRSHGSSLKINIRF
jgi:hypothetical protein